MKSHHWLLLLILILAIELSCHFIFPNSTVLDLEAESIGQITQVDLASVEEQIAVENKKIYFVGDVMLARDVERKLVGTSVVSALANFLPLWSSHFVVVNFEAAIPKLHQPTPDFAFRFSVKEELLPGLNAAGISHVSLANNHAYDFGLSGYKNSASSLTEVGIIPFGHPYDLATSSVSVVDIGNNKVAVIALSPVTTEINFEVLNGMISELSGRTDLQIAYVHWGEEYVNNQSPVQRRIATELANAGIDVVIGHHPHVIQGIEQINNTLVFYSLGNFLFDQYFSEAVQTGLMLELSFDSDSYIFTLIPVSSLESRVKPYLLEGEAKQVVIKNLADWSDESQREAILSERIVWSQPLASSTEVVIMTP